MGVALVYARLSLGPGEEVVTSEHDFFATHESLRLREQLDGVTVRRVRLYDEPESASVDGIVSAVSRALGPRTRALALTWVHSSSGVKLPLREIAAAVAHANRGRRERERILLCVDGVHGFGVEDASPADLGIDVLASGCHKWLFGPRGTGFVWAAPHAWRRLAPTIPSFDPRVYGAWIEGRPPHGRAARRADDARRLPLVRAPLGAARGGEGPRRAGRPRGGGAADARPRRGAEGRAGRHRRRPAQDAARRGAVGRARVLRGERASTPARWWTACARSTGWWRA